MTTTEIEKHDGTPSALVKQYADSFAAVLPSHVAKPETWIRLAQGALKKGKRQNDGRTELEVAAANNPQIFLATLLDCARLGLEPGTEEYYLTPRKVKGGRTEILGIVGYQGYIELMYRAGAVTSVVAECVYTNDRFRFRPGVDEIPDHEIDWDSADRGHLRLVYAFARMRGGATSKVVVLNAADIDRLKKKSQGAGSEYSPWNTDEPSMWLKSAVRQLRKWVPTSSEYIREQMRIAQDVAAERMPAGVADGLPIIADREDQDLDDDEPIEAEVVAEAPAESEPAADLDDDVADAEIVEEPPAEPEAEPAELAKVDGDVTGWDAAAWKAGLEAHGVRVTQAIKQAQQVARELEREGPATIAALAADPEIAQLVWMWVVDQ